MRIICLALLLPLLALSSRACTIFILTDDKTALFCNNEDWSSAATRLWFVPGGTNHFACVYVGFDNGWAQGGVNSEGLAFDWVAGGSFDYNLDTKHESVRGNSSQRMLESCSTVAEAVAFYKKHREASFSRARVLVADRTGASAIIGARDGQVFAEISNTSRGFGYGNRPLQEALLKKPKPTINAALTILRACSQKGEFATKYSNVFDLKSGDIHIFSPDSERPITLNFAAELVKGPHYYDIPKLHEQLAAPPKPLLQNMRRLPLDAYKTIPDHSPEITAQIRGMLERSAREPLRETDYAPDFWKKLAPQAGEIHKQLRDLGPLNSIDRVETDPGDSPRAHRFRIDFEYATILVGYVLDEQNRIASIITGDIEQRSR